MGPLQAYTRGIQASIRFNAQAYAYSVLATATFAVLAALIGDPGVDGVFLFIAGATASFATVEALATNFFRKRIRGERAEVVVLGSAMAIFSVSAGVGAGALVGSLLRWNLGWFLGAFCASIVHLAVAGIELALAHRAEQEIDEED